MSWITRMREDIGALKAKDPAARNTVEVLLAYPGLHAIWMHRVNHWLWRHGAKLAARVLADIVRRRTGVEIHPGATLGRRVVIDHGMGVVIGETAVVGEDVLIYQGVTLGGIKSNGGKRHPTVGNRVMLGAHSTLLGPIHIGDDARIGACVTMRESVPAGASVREEPVISMRLPHPPEVTNLSICGEQVLPGGEGEPGHVDEGARCSQGDRRALTSGWSEAGGSSGGAHEREGL